jgi:hypothetical protein
MVRAMARVLPAVLFAAAFASAAAASEAEKLVRAYPDSVAGIDGNELVFKDGSRMAVSDGLTGKTGDELLNAPDLDDIFSWTYPKAFPQTAPQEDPGRIRPHAFFAKMYGDCSKGGVTGDLVWVDWMPSHGGRPVQMTRINGAAAALAAVSAELDRMPKTMTVFLVPSAGTFKCRVIAGTSRPSAHGYGIAIDIAIEKSDYWQWSKTGRYRNRIPREIVEVFERHGFIWGGKWKAFDTMHFEYRPELLLD